MNELDFGKVFGGEDEPQQKREYEIIPTDEYDVVVKETKIELGGGSPRAIINYTIVGDSKFKNRVLFSSFSLTEQGARILKQSLKFLGVQVQNIRSLDDLSNELLGIHGKPYIVKAVAKTYVKTDGSTGHGHNVYVQDKPLDNASQSNDALSKATKDMGSDNFKF